MKKNRNSFFAESNLNYNIPNPTIPYQSSTNYNSFYSGPGINPQNNYLDNNYESRFAKIERQLNRLEHRTNKLESTSNNTYIDEIDTSGNMYML